MGLHIQKNRSNGQRSRKDLPGPASPHPVVDFFLEVITIASMLVTGLGSIITGTFYLHYSTWALLFFVTSV